MSEEIRTVQQRIQEEVIPTAKKLEDAEHDMVGFSRTAANYLLLAKKGIQEHVVPHLQHAMAAKDDVLHTGVHMITHPDDVKTAAHAVLGDIPLYTDSIEPAMTKIQKDTDEASLKVIGPLFAITQHALEALEILEKSLGEASDAAFKRVDDIKNNDISATHATITALEEFRL